MTREERRKILEKLELPTAAVRRQLLEIFEDLAVVKRNEQVYFLPAEIVYAVDLSWKGPDQPTVEEIEFYLKQAVAAKREHYVKHSEFGYGYIMQRDH